MVFRKFLTIFVLFFIFWLNISTSQAANTVLSMASLPTAQGWIYDDGGSGTPEGNIFTLVGGVLHLDSIGDGFSGFTYQKLGGVDPTRPFVLTARLRVTNYEIQSPGNPFGFDLSIITGVEEVELAISPVGIYVGNGTLVTNAVDVTVYHTYEIRGAEGSPFEILIDGTSYGTYAPTAIGFANKLYIGDGTAGANSQADISSYSFIQTVVAEASNDEDDELRPVFFDGRINDFDTGNPVVLYGKPDTDEAWRLEVYNADSSGLLLVISSEQIALVAECPSGNTLIYHDPSTRISLWRLESCQFQLNAPTDEAGKWYIIIFDTLYPHTYYESHEEYIGL